MYLTSYCHFDVRAIEMSCKKTPNTLYCTMQLAVLLNIIIKNSYLKSKLVRRLKLVAYLLIEQNAL